MAEFTEFRIKKSLTPVDTERRRWKWSVQLQALVALDGNDPMWRDAMWAGVSINSDTFWCCTQGGQTRSREKALRKMHAAEATCRAAAHRHNALAMTQEIHGIRETARL